MTPRSSRSHPTFGQNGQLRREDFTRERIDKLRAFANADGQEWVSSHEERDRSRAAATEHLKKGAPVWIFGYGSLMWNPAIHVVASSRAQVFGYHRSFCLSLTLGRGSPDKPGLMLGLDRGGSCVGIAHRIAGQHVESELEILWMREMLGGTYTPKWLSADIGGTRRTVLTFVANHDHERYIGPQPFKKAARLIAKSEGILGSNRGYLYNTIKELDALGIGDGPLHALEAEVRRLAKDH